MRISRWKKSKRQHREAGMMIHVSIREAHKIIQSIASQLYLQNCNVERAEFFTDEGEYVSISVTGADELGRYPEFKRVPPVYAPAAPRKRKRRRT